MINPIEQYVIDVAYKLRRESNLSQKEFALILNAKHSFIGNVENIRTLTKYNLKHINLMAEHFNISPREFMPKDPIL